jgi:hypothetical protein
MKKLNLKVANLNATEILSREELRKVVGGEGSDPIANFIGSILGAVCDNTPCTHTIQGSDGSWVTRTGHCSAGASYPHCYCDTGLGDVRLTSNGGISRCNS